MQHGSRGIFDELVRVALFVCRPSALKHRGRHKETLAVLYRVLYNTPHTSCVYQQKQLFDLDLFDTDAKSC